MRKFVLGMAACAAILAISATAVASTPTLTYTGQGWIDNGNGGFIRREKWMPRPGLRERLSGRYRLAIFTGRPSGV